MGAYIRVSDVQAQLPQVPISADDVLKPANVEAYIGIIEAEIEASLSGQGIVVPVTGERSINILRSLGMPGVLQRVYRSLNTQPGINAGDDTSAEAERMAWKDNKRLLSSGAVTNQLLQDAETDPDINFLPVGSSDYVEDEDETSTWEELTNREYLKRENGGY